MNTNVTNPEAPSPESLRFAAAGGDSLTLDSPFRGTLVVGGADSGKTTAIAYPMVEQFTQKNFAGLVYGADAGLAAKVLEAKTRFHGLPALNEPIVQVSHLNFDHLAQSVRLNPWHPTYIPHASFAMQFAATLLASAGQRNTNDFFSSTSINYLAAIILYYRNNNPSFCTIPHVIETAVSDNYTHVLRMLGEDAAAQVLVQSFVIALKTGAEKQIAGIVASLRINLEPLRQPAITWALTPTDNQGKGLSLDLNDPDHPTLLTITPPASSGPGFVAAISSVVTTALNQMNRPRQHRSYVLLDDAETLLIRDLEVIPVTCRSNKLAFAYLTRDVAHLVEAYGRDNSQVLISGLSNQFFGRITSPQTGAAATMAAGAALLPDAVYTPLPFEFIGQLATNSIPAHFRATLIPSAAPAQSAPGNAPAQVETMNSNALAVRLAVQHQLDKYPDAL